MQGEIFIVGQLVQVGVDEVGQSRGLTQEFWTIHEGRN